MCELSVMSWSYAARAIHGHRRLLCLAVSAILFVGLGVPTAADGEGRSSGDPRAEHRLFYTRDDILRHIRLWNSRDRYTAALLSDYFCEAAWANPWDFFDLMGGEPKVFDDWVVALPDLTFVDHGDCVDRENWRQGLIEDFGQMGDDKAPKALRDKLVSRLKSVKVRKVETGTTPRDWLAGGPILYSKDDLLRMIPKWERRDGAAVGEISDYFCQFVVHNPQGFLNGMVGRKAFDEWFGGLPDTSFATANSEDYLECLRNVMIASLRRADVNSSTRPLRDRLVARLESIRVRVID